MLEKTQTLKARLNKALESGVAVNQDKVNEFKLKLENANSKFNQAQQLISDSNNITQETIESINQLNQESRESLKEAHNILKEILSEIRIQDKTFDLNEVENE